MHTTPQHSFLEKLRKRQAETGSVLCVGLDPDFSKIPIHMRRVGDPLGTIVGFNRAIIAATSDYVCAYKLNFAFYEAYGVEGWKALEQTVDMLPAECVSIADAKRGDIGNTAGFYAKSVFKTMNFDACTVAPYMGLDAIEPFLKWEGRGVFVLCRTSNKSADDFQLSHGGRPETNPLYERVAQQVARWDAEYPGCAGLVVGATRPADLKRMRELCPTLPFLIPGVGAQGGDPAAVISAALTDDGPVLVNSSRGILYAGADEEFVAASREAARKASQDLRAR